MNRQIFWVMVAILSLVFACQKSEEIIENKFRGFKKPLNFPEPTYNFAGNPISEKGFALGKKLFYDPILSRDNSISCGSCHIAQHAFTHHGHDVSHGIEDRQGTRNSMPLFNLAWNRSFFWDGGVFHLDLFPIAPIENPVEMDEKLSHVLQKLQQSKTYPTLFKEVFGTSEINSINMFKAMSQFMVMLVSDQSKYDKVMRMEATFSAEENAGYVIFQANCNACHQEPLFTDQQYRDNGIGENSIKDQGRFEISQLEEDRLKFKVPSLRNLRYTAPYMHDGQFRTLEAVINHYRREIKATKNLDPLLKEKMKIELSDLEVQQLMAFLNTLNDDNFVNNSLYHEF